MRILILKDTRTVGRMLKAGELVNLQEPLAAALVKMGAAEVPVQNLPPGFPRPEPFRAPEQTEAVVSVTAEIAEEIKEEETKEAEPVDDKPKGKRK